MILKLSLLVIVLLYVGTPTSGSKPECDKKAFERCNERLFMVGDDTFVFPKNIPEMNKRCKELKSLETCTKSYASKCLSKESKQSVSVLTYGVTKTNKGYCGTKARKQAFIKLAACLTKQKPKLDRLMWQMSSDFKAIADLYTDKRTKIPISCCNYYKFKTGVMATVGNQCPEELTEIEALIDGYAQDVLNLFCGEYTEDSDKCTKLVDKTPKWTKKAPSKIFVLPMVDVFDSL